MLEVRPLTIADQKKWIRRLYANNRRFIDNKSALVDLVRSPSGAFFRNSAQRALQVSDAGLMLAQAVFIRHDKKPDTLMIAFVEAAEERTREALDTLLQTAQSQACAWNCSKLQIGIDGHCNYNLGIAGDELCPSFGAPFNTKALGLHLDALYDWRTLRFFTFRDSFDHCCGKIEKDYLRIPAMPSAWSIQSADWGRGFARTIERYTSLNNRIFSGHAYYDERSIREDKQLFASMRPLLSPDNLLFIGEGDRDFGFMLWYPDYNEFVRPGRGFDWSAFLRYKLLGHRAKTVKIVEIGLLPERRNRAAVLYLLRDAMRAIRRQHPGVKEAITSWVYEKNQASTLITRRYFRNQDQEWHVYERSV